MLWVSASFKSPNKNFHTDKGYISHIFSRKMYIQSFEQRKFDERTIYREVWTEWKKPVRDEEAPGLSTEGSIRKGSWVLGSTRRRVLTACRESFNELWLLIQEERASVRLHPYRECEGNTSISLPPHLLNSSWWCSAIWQIQPQKLEVKWDSNLV